MGYIIQKFSFLIKIMIINKKKLKEKRRENQMFSGFLLRDQKWKNSAHLLLFSSPLFLLPLFNSQDLILGGSKVVSCNMELAQPRITALSRLCSKRSAAYLSCLLLASGPHKKLLIEVRLNPLYAFTVESIQMQFLLSYVCLLQTLKDKEKYEYAWIPSTE